LRNKLPGSNLKQFDVLVASRRTTCYTFYGVVGWFGKCMEIKLRKSAPCNYTIIANKACWANIAASEQFQINVHVGLKCVN